MSGAFAGDQEFKRPFKDGLNEKIETMSERISKMLGNFGIRFFEIHIQTYVRYGMMI